MDCYINTGTIHADPSRVGCELLPVHRRQIWYIINNTNKLRTNTYNSLRAHASNAWIVTQTHDRSNRRITSHHCITPWYDSDPWSLIADSASDPWSPLNAITWFYLLSSCGLIKRRSWQRRSRNLARSFVATHTTEYAWCHLKTLSFISFISNYFYGLLHQHRHNTRRPNLCYCWTFLCICRHRSCIQSVISFISNYITPLHHSMIWQRSMIADIW